jgi:type I restriction enzyme S subunit
LVNGKAFKPTDWSSAGVPIIRIQNLNGADKPFNHWAGVLDKQVLVKTGDLLLAWSGTPGTSFGAHIWSGPNGILNQHIFRCDLDQKAVTKEWARIAVNHRLHRLIEQAHGGVGLQHVTRGMVEELEIPLPSLAEQRRIAEVLDRAEALRAKRRAALAKLDSLTQSLFLDLFGDPATNPKGWPNATLGDVTQMVTGYPFRSEEYVTNGDSVRLCRGANILPGRVDWSDLARWPKSKMAGLEEFSLEVGDVVIAMDRPWISEGFKIARVQPEDCPALLVQRVARLRGGKKLPNAFLFHLLNQPAFTRHCRPTETTIPHISPNDIRSFAFPVPPIDLQREFARRVMAVEKLETAQRASLVELDELFACLQHRAFRGEL